MPERAPVVAAVPTWNMTEQVTRLVSELQTQEFDAIFVLDDASTDNTSQHLHEALSPSRKHRQQSFERRPHLGCI